MRAIRKHLMRERGCRPPAYDVMGYWRGGSAGRQPRAVDPGRSGAPARRAGKTDEQIWAEYDEARVRGGQAVSDRTVPSGFASFVGRPNAGKSTLTNALVGRRS